MLLIRMVKWQKNGSIVAFKSVDGNEDLMIVTDSGIIIRVSLEQVSTTGRVAQGVKLINSKDNQKVSTITRIEKDEESIEEESDITVESNSTDNVSRETLQDDNQ